jgi:hypothetical protein
MTTRKSRGVTQKLFLIENVPSTNTKERKFVIMGSTGNVYTVSITNTPSCNCPDYVTRGNRCKHIYFVLLRIMKVFNPDIATYTDTDLVIMFASIPQVNDSIVADNKTITKYKKMETNNQIQQKGTDDNCLVCLDELENGEDLTYCNFSCGKPIHKLCFEMISKKSVPNCLFCSKPFNVQQQYVNLID